MRIQALTFLSLSLVAFLTACPGSDDSDPGTGEGEGEGAVGEGEGEGAVGEGEGEVGEGEGEVGEGEGEGEGEGGEGEGEGETFTCGNRDQNPGDACSTGLGACQRSGEFQCAAQDRMICTAVPGPRLAETDTTDDDVDDDCDGTADEDTCQVDPGRGTSCSAGVGACLVTGTRECTNNALACTAVARPTPTTPDDDADGIDDDCDGTADEDALACRSQPNFGRPCTTGVGECESSGTFVCAAGGDNVECSAVAGQPTATSETIINGRDDDCDGSIDEDATFPDRVACDPAATCCFANVYNVSREGFFHVDLGPDPNAAPCDPALGSANPRDCKRQECSNVFDQLVWQNNPPASGPHKGCTWGQWGTHYDALEPLPRDYYVHNLEHGGAVFLYGPSASAAAVTELLAAFNNLSNDAACAVAPINQGGPRITTLAVATFDPLLPTNVPVAVVVVDRILLPDASGIIPRAAAIEYAQACRNNGPEKACFNGMPVPTAP